MRFASLFIFFVLSTMLSAQDTEAYEKRTFKSKGQVIHYRILFPSEFELDKEYPLILFLHGMGERGIDNETQLIHGAKLFSDSIHKYPAIVVFPQCPPTDYWANLYRPDQGGANRIFEFHIEEAPHPTMNMVLQLVDSLLLSDSIDSDRFYVSGLSMGAMGVWELLWRIPEKIAAAAPICGGGPQVMAGKMTMPIWAFHGVQDNVVHSRMSIQMVKAVQRSGGKAKITLFPKADHNAWDPAFADSDFLSWLFSHKKQ